MEEIITVKTFYEEKYKEKGSVFIGQVYPVKSEDEFAEILAKVKKEFYDASHHCFAFKLAGGLYKYSDAGEPNGTAGVRILNAIDHFGLSNTGIIVIRYFGGTKLGVGPLGKAYYSAALSAVEKAEKIKLCSFYEVIFEIAFDEVSHAHRALNNFRTEIVNIDYEDLVIFKCLIRCRSIPEFEKQLSEVLSRKIVLKISEIIVYKNC